MTVIKRVSLRGPTYRDAESVGVVDTHEGADGDRAVCRQRGDDLDVDDLMGGRRTGGWGRVRRRKEDRGPKGMLYFEGGSREAKRLK